MAKSIVNSNPYPFHFETNKQFVVANHRGNAQDVTVTIPNVRGRIPSPQASRIRSMMLEAHGDPNKILAHVCSYDGLSSRLCQEAGFPLIFLAGYAMASALGLPDTGYIAFQEVVQKIQETVRQVSVPVLVDGDTGYGGPMNVRRTVEGFALAGAAGTKHTFEIWTDTYRTNVPQIFFLATAFLPLLQAAHQHNDNFSGTVINISSISGIVKTAQHHFAYNASKAAAIHLTSMLANEVAQNGLKIRINSIAPGVFPSEMTAKDSGEDQKSHVPREKYQDKVPARRPGEDRDMANAVLFAATNQYLNGQTVAVDGGYILSEGSGP